MTFSELFKTEYYDKMKTPGHPNNPVRNRADSFLKIFQLLEEKKDKNFYIVETGTTRADHGHLAFGDDGAQAYFYGSPAGTNHNISTTTKEDWDNMRLAHQQTMADWANVGVIPYRTGRTWRPHVLDKLDSSYRKYINVMKKTFDPNNIMNPGVSVFEEVY